MRCVRALVVLSLAWSVTACSEARPAIVDNGSGCAPGYALVNGRCEGGQLATDASADGADATDATDATDALSDGTGDSAIPPVGLGLLEACSGSENVMALRGAKGDITFETSAVIHEGTKKWTGTNGSGEFNASVIANPRELGVGSTWYVGFQSVSYSTDLKPGIYKNALFNNDKAIAAGVPGMTVQVDARTCLNLTGEFQIHEIAYERADGALPNVIKLVASFTRTCPTSGTTVSGCIRWQRSP